MSECIECKSEINSTDDLVIIEGNKVCPYCFYVFENEYSLDSIVRKSNDLELLDMITKKEIIRQITSNNKGKYYNYILVLLWILSISYTILFFIITNS